MKYSIKILDNGKFRAYVIHKNKSEWCKRTAKKLIESCSQKSHFKGCEFILEEN
jgi:hypothetical protein